MIIKNGHLISYLTLPLPLSLTKSSEKKCLLKTKKINLIFKNSKTLQTLSLSSLPLPLPLPLSLSLSLSLSITKKFGKMVIKKDRVNIKKYLQTRIVC